MSAADVLGLISDTEARFVDLRFTDTRGKEQHVTLPTSEIDDDFFEDGKMFDGSSIDGWKGINESDMILMPDPATAVVDVFCEETTINLRCDIVEPNTMQGYERDPRSLAKRAEAYLRSTGIADSAYFGPENEFFVFDDVRWGSQMSGSFYRIDSAEAGWNSEKVYEQGNIGHRPGVKGGYFPVPPVDSLQDLRSAMCLAMEEMGVPTEVHHHEVSTAGQCEIGARFNTLVRKADEVQIFKYAVLNVAHTYGKTATFMPKPVVGDNGSGMHVHQSLSKGGENLFTGDGYGGLSETALFYIGGIIKHARALNAFTNAGDEQLQAIGSRIRGAGQARLLIAQSLCIDTDSVYQQSKGTACRDSFPGLDGQPLPRVLGDDDGRSRRYPEQNPSGRPDGQEPLRPGSRRVAGHSRSVLLARSGPGGAGPGSRFPEGRRGVYRRSD